MDTFSILLVDDRAENLVSLEELLEAPNRKFLKATNGLDALKMVLKYPDLGLILLDVQMPEMDGFEVATLLHSNPQTRQIPFVFVTANLIEDKSVLKGFQTGAADYLVKPLNAGITRAKVAVYEELYFQKQELKKAIAERDQVNAQLERYTKVMAHDLKTPLAGIVSLVGLVKMNDQVQEIPDVAEELDLLETLSEDLSKLISTVLEDSRKLHDQSTEGEVSVEHLIRKCITLLQAPNTVRFKIDENLPIFKTHEVALQQVFQNLLGNAIKYNNNPQGLISVGVSDAGDYYKFHVKDNGPGIPTDKLDDIFEPFVTGAAKSNLDSSTGLGLHFMKIMVEEQGGKIWAESAVGEGSTFYFLWKK